MTNRKISCKMTSSAVKAAASQGCRTNRTVETKWVLRANRTVTANQAARIAMFRTELERDTRI